MRLKFRAVLFDMDGVITNTMPYHFDAWLNVLSCAGIRVNCFEVYKREGQDGLTTVKEIFKEHKKKISLPQARLILEKKENLLQKIVKAKFIKGARQFLRKLKQDQALIGLVTGTSRKEVNKIMPKDLLAVFNVIITGDEVNRGKPNPEPFIKALSLLGASRREAVVIENAPFGITAAKKAGIFCIALETSLPRAYLKEADTVCKSFKDLKSLIYF